MFDVTAFLTAGGILLVFALLSWLVSLIKNDVSIVDSLWSIMILLAGLTYYFLANEQSTRSTLVIILASIWAIRLSAYITWRNHGQPEDYRYQQIRANNEPNFRLKSLYIVFGLQALLGWFVSLPLLAAINSNSDLNWLDYIALALFLFGLFFEVVGDQQMANFKANSANKGKVMDRGLWGYTRHPNYFGEFCIWWGFFGFALAAGGWWSLLSPVLMTFLLLKVSGVAMLEKDIGQRRPGYAEYSTKTPAFFPRLARK